MPIAVDTDPGGGFAILTITDPYRREALAPSLVFVDQVVGFFRSHEPQLVKARVGIVTNETLAFGMSRMVELKAEASLPAGVIRVFRDYHTATRWLTRRDTMR